MMERQYTTLNPNSPESPELYTTSEVAAWLRYRSPQKAAKIFQGVQGVIDIEEGPGGNKRGPKHHILIPRHILKRFCEDHSGRKTKLQQAQEEMRVRNSI